MIECDGSGEEVFYESNGVRLLLCETLIPHRHCECGMPMPTWVERCSYCLREAQGISNHHQTGFVRETVEHGDAFSNKILPGWIFKAPREPWL